MGPYGGSWDALGVLRDGDERDTLAVGGSGSKVAGYVRQEVGTRMSGD